MKECIEDNWPVRKKPIRLGHINCHNHPSTNDFCDTHTHSSYHIQIISKTRTSGDVGMLCDMMIVALSCCVSCIDHVVAMYGLGLIGN